MDFKKFNEIAELVGIVAIVASLIFVGLELRQSHNIAKAEVMANYVANSTEKNNAIILRPDVWLKGNAGEELSEAEQVVFEYQVLNENDRAWFAIEQYKLIGYEDWVELDAMEFAIFLYQNPGARKVWIARENRREPYFAVLMNNDGDTSEFGDNVSSYLNILDSRFGELDVQAE